MTDRDPSHDETQPFARAHDAAPDSSSTPASGPTPGPTPGQSPLGPPPSHDPYGNPYPPPAYDGSQPGYVTNPYAVAYQPATQHLAQHVPQQQPRHRGWSWRATIAGAAAGAVLAASVAVPVTWALNRNAAPASSEASSGAVQDPSQLTPPDGSEGDGQAPDSGDQSGQDPFGSYGYGGSTSQQSGSQTDATADESTGVVLIDTRTTSGEAAGTGLVIDSSGLVLTNYHVVEGSTSIQVTIASTGDTYEGTVVGHDQTADVALVQLDGASDLATVTTDDDDPAVSDEVTAVGNAQGQGYLSASTGQVVALDQSIDTASEGTVEGEHLTGLIQTDAYVVGGYSGGALLDDEGEVVGITTAASSGGQSESYAIPIDDALDIAEQIESGDESGTVQVGPSAYLGVAIATSNGSVEVSQVESDGAAATAGVEAGATITGVGEATISSYDDLRTALAGYEPGDSAVLKWTDANGKAHTATVTLGESPVN